MRTDYFMGLCFRLPQYLSKPSSSRASTICIMSLATKAVLIKLPSSLAFSEQVSAKLDAHAQVFPSWAFEEFPEPS